MVEECVGGEQVFTEKCTNKNPKGFKIRWFADVSCHQWGWGEKSYFIKSEGVLKPDYKWRGNFSYLLLVKKRRGRAAEKEATC